MYPHLPRDSRLVVAKEVRQAHYLEFIEADNDAFELARALAPRPETAFARFAGNPSRLLWSHVWLSELCIHMHYNAKKIYVNNNVRLSVSGWSGMKVRFP
jgi:hypothetical protein